LTIVFWQQTNLLLAVRNGVVLASRGLWRGAFSERLGDIVTLTDAAERLSMVIDERPRTPFPMLVDPFKYPIEVWPTVSTIVEAVDHQELFGVIEVFAHRDFLHIVTIW
jgi:hypothetical protein